MNLRVIKAINIFLSIVALSFALAPFVLRFHFCADDYNIISAPLSNKLPIRDSFINSSSSFLFRPLVTLSYAINFLISGWTPWPYYLFNLLLHGFNSYLCSLLVVKMSSIGRNKSFLIGILFFIMPYGLVNVYWIAGRSDLLCFAFTVAAVLLSYDYWTNSKLWSFGVSIILFLLALMSKEAGLLFLIYSMIFLVLSALGLENKISSKRVWHSILITTVVTLGYLFYRYSIFGVLVGDQNPDQQTNLYRLANWIFHSIWYLVIPFDFIDVISIWSVYPFFAIAVLLPLILSLIVFVTYFLKNNGNNRLRIVILSLGAFISLGIYVRSFPSERLFYLILPFAIATACLIFQSERDNRLLQIALILYLCSIMLSSSTLVYKYHKIAAIEKSSQTSITDHGCDKADTLFVLGQIGRMGESYVSSSKSLEYSPIYVVSEFKNFPIPVVVLGTFEGTILTDWTNPYIITVNSDTIILKSNDPFSGFVPLPARKFTSFHAIKNGNYYQAPTAFTELRKGVASEIKIYPTPRDYAHIVYYKNGQFTEVCFSEFRRLFSNTAKSIGSKLHAPA